MKKALITGITGQDGSYLAQLLLGKGYEVHGLVRKSSTFNTERLDYLLDNPDIAYKRLHLHFGDLTDSSNLNRVLNRIKPDEIYNLAAQSHVKVSFEMPEYTSDVDGLGVIRLLDAMRDTGINCKFYQASTSELFGGLSETIPQNEDTPFTPRSPYACAKLLAYWIVVNYREAYGMFTCNGILFNHESETRLPTFITRKVTQAVSRIYNGKQEILSVGNLDAVRDWGFAGDYVKGMWLMLQQDKPDDYVLATGVGHTIRELIEEAFYYIDIDIEWVGKGVNEVGLNKKTRELLVNVEERFFRPTEVNCLIGNASKAESILKWKPKVGFYELIRRMMQNDLKING